MRIFGYGALEGPKDKGARRLREERGATGEGRGFSVGKRILAT
jgi:hypothetical protein